MRISPASWCSSRNRPIISIDRSRRSRTWSRSPRKTTSRIVKSQSRRRSAHVARLVAEALAADAVGQPRGGHRCGPGSGGRRGSRPPATGRPRGSPCRPRHGRRGRRDRGAGRGRFADPVGVLEQMAGEGDVVGEGAEVVALGQHAGRDQGRREHRRGVPGVGRRPRRRGRSSGTAAGGARRAPPGPVPSWWIPAVEPSPRNWGSVRGRAAVHDLAPEAAQAALDAA